MSAVAADGIERTESGPEPVAAPAPATEAPPPAMTGEWGVVELSGIHCARRHWDRAAESVKDLEMVTRALPSIAEAVRPYRLRLEESL